MLYRTRQHPFGRIAAAGRGILAVGLALALWLTIATGILAMPDATGPLSLVALFLFLLGAANIGLIYLRWRAEDYAITNRRILKVGGLLNKTSADSSLEKINDAILEQSFLGRIFDWGDLRVLTAASEVADDYHLLHHAATFKKIMLSAKQEVGDLQTRRIVAPIDELNARAEARDRAAGAADRFAQPAAPAPAPAPAAAPFAAPPGAEPTTAERLQTLSDLLDAGLITSEDYEAKKAAILATL